MKKIILDTETTGTVAKEGHKIIEIGCVKIHINEANGRFVRTGETFQVALNPEREIDEGATRVHGKTFEMLKNEPKFDEIADEFLNFIGEDEIIAHNANFDIGFINAELSCVSKNILKNEVTDSLMIARRFFPGQPASLDALCRRFGVDNTNRTLHGALLDAELLCDVFIKMIEFLEDENRFEGKFDYKVKKQDTGTIKRNVNFGYRKFAVSNEEMEKHKEFLKSIGF